MNEVMACGTASGGNVVGILVTAAVGLMLVGIGVAALIYGRKAK